jgi:hypothetical protein
MSTHSASTARLPLPLPLPLPLTSLLSGDVVRRTAPARP